MSQRVDQLCDSLRNRLNKLEDRVESVKHKIEAAPRQAVNILQSQADQLRTRVDEKRPAVEQARERVQQWQAQEKALLKQSFAQWKANRQFDRLEAKAQEAERYADAAVDVALSAIDEAEVATLDAVAAWQDVDTFQVEQRQPRKWILEERIWQHGQRSACPSPTCGCRVARPSPRPPSWVTR